MSFSLASAHATIISIPDTIGDPIHVTGSINGLFNLASHLPTPNLYKKPYDITSVHIVFDYTDDASDPDWIAHEKMVEPPWELTSTPMHIPWTDDNDFYPTKSEAWGSEV